MGINLASVAAGYQGFAQENQRLADVARREKADARADQDAAFQEEARNRQRADWKEVDRIKAADKQDLADVQALAAADASADQAAAESAKAGEQIQASGIPKPRNFNDSLAQQAELLRRKSARGDLSPKDFMQGMQFVNAMRSEGVNEALRAFSAGDYEGGLSAFNQIGRYKGAKIVSGEAGTTKIDGQDMPTHIITVANPDGTRTVVDTTKAQYQLLDLNSQLAHSDRSRQIDLQASQHADQLKLSRDQLTQHAKDAEAGRAIQQQSLRLQQDQFAATTPLGQITAMGKALGRPLSADEIENRLGLSRIPRAVELQVDSLMKENDNDTQAQAKAIASPEGINPAAAATFQKNAAIRNERLRQLLAPFSGGGRGAASPSLSDPLNLRQQSSTGPGGVIVPNPLSTEGAGENTGVRAALAGKVAERDARIAQFNRAVGGANQSRAAAIEQRAADVAQNFDTYLAAIQPGMSRDDQQRVLSWMTQQADAGLLSNEQLRQVRIARSNARM